MSYTIYSLNKTHRPSMYTEREYFITLDLAIKTLQKRRPDLYIDKTADYYWAIDGNYTYNIREVTIQTE